MTSEGSDQRFDRPIAKKDLEWVRKIHCPEKAIEEHDLDRGRLEEILDLYLSAARPDMDEEARKQWITKDLDIKTAFKWLTEEGRVNFERLSGLSKRIEFRTGPYEAKLSAAILLAGEVRGWIIQLFFNLGETDDPDVIEDTKEAFHAAHLALKKAGVCHIVNDGIF